jgi:hypothetical protein
MPLIHMSYRYREHIPKDRLFLDSRHVLMSVYGTSTPGQTELGSSEEEARTHEPDPLLSTH